MDRIWLRNYPEGVPHDVDPSRYPTVTSLIEESLKNFADRHYSICMGARMSYRELDRHSAALGAWLQSLGLEPGARVALMLPNVPQFPVTMAAILRAGYTCVNVNPLYTARELEHQLKDSGAAAIVILENFAHTLQEVVARTSIRHVAVSAMGDLMGGLKGALVTFAVRRIKKMVPAFSLSTEDGLTVTPFKRALALGAGWSLKPVRQSPDSVAFLQYTGGTTGLSKGAMLTHRAVVAATLSADEWCKPALATGDGEQRHAIAALPLYHIFALILCLLATRQGWVMTLVPNPRDFKGFVKTLAARPFHILPAVNTLFNALLQQPEFKNVDFSRLRISQAGGMAASPGTAQRWLETTGCPMVEGWGMSETCGIGTNNPVTSREFTGTIGLPMSGIDIAIKDDEGRNLPLGEIGELCIRGANVMSGYYNQPDETRRAFTADGFLRTGDVAQMDERGHVRIVDRKKDMIIVSGFNVFPNEIENVISTCPGIVECAVVGVPDEAQGEAIKVFAVKSDPALTEDAVLAHCHDRLTGYKRPRHVEFRAELPKSNVGKILRRELRAASVD
ncbi:MAG: AMP-binding protein [Pseudomonadota bacterium]|nr:AMP-binding protein [Pseudomonadota bacterium]